MEKLVVYKLLPGDLVTRCRIGKGYEKVSELSYIPQDDSAPAPALGRANRQGESIFYGVITEKNGLQDTRYVSLYETSEFLRDINSRGVENVTYSRWEVIQPMALALVVHSSRVYENNHFLMSCQNYLRQHRAELEERAGDLWIADNDKYAEMLSTPGHAIYPDTSEWCGRIYETGSVDGIIYPSVMTDAQYGANVAILPKAVDDKLRFQRALVCRLQKEGEKADLIPGEFGVLRNGKIEYERCQN